jgi:hypothetical protein
VVEPAPPLVVVAPPPVVAPPTTVAPTADAAPVTSHALPRGLDATPEPTTAAGVEVVRRSTWGQATLTAARRLPRGGLLASGFFSQTALFAPGTSRAALKTAAGAEAGFVVALDAQGELSWLQVVGGRALGVVPTADGGALSVHECGDLDALPEGVHLPPKPWPTTDRALVARWARDGSLQWSRWLVMKRLTGFIGVRAFPQELPDGRVTLATQYESEQRLLGPSGVAARFEAEVVASPHGPSQVFGTAWYLLGADGALVSARALTFDGAFPGLAACELDAQGRVVLAGNLSQLSPTEDLSAPYVAWMEPAGVPSRLFRGPGQPVAPSLSFIVPTSLGVLAVGMHHQPADFGGGQRLLHAGSQDEWLAFFGAPGTLSWVRTVGGPSADGSVLQFADAQDGELHAWGRTGPDDFQVNFGLGDAQTWHARKPAAYPSVHLRWSPAGALLGMDTDAYRGAQHGWLHQNAELARVGCCQRTSKLTLTPLPRPAAPVEGPAEVKAWLEQALAGVDVGHVHVDDVAVGGAVRRQLSAATIAQWELAPARAPGTGGGLGARTLVGQEGLASTISLRPLPTARPTLGDVRSFMGNLPSFTLTRQGKVLRAQYCTLPIAGGVTASFSFTDGLLDEVWLTAAVPVECKDMKL